MNLETIISNTITVRQSETSDHENIVSYFLNADENFLINMGVDISKLPTKKDWIEILDKNAELNKSEKEFYYLIWLLDDQPVGHSNINKIVKNESAFMHLHLWTKQKRQSGLGEQFLKMTIPYYFESYNLKNLYCEPSAFNLPPNKTLKKMGFELLDTYDTTPGWINFHQTVNKWCLTRKRFEELYVKSDNSRLA
jgi:RimJ/RimL family protein N-acetyltransferase